MTVPQAGSERYAAKAPIPAALQKTFNHMVDSRTMRLHRFLRASDLLIESSSRRISLQLCRRPVNRAALRNSAAGRVLDLKYLRDKQLSLKKL
jgi:hypothetical protein